MRSVISFAEGLALVCTIAISAATAQEQILTLSELKPGEPPDPEAIRMIDRLRGWTIVEFTFFYTTDGARTWSKVPADPSRFLPEGPWGVMTEGGAWSVAVGSGRESGRQKLLRMMPGSPTELLPLPCDEICVVGSVAFDPVGRKGLLIELVHTDSIFYKIYAFRTVDGGHRWVGTAAPDTTVFRGDVDLNWSADEHALVVGASGFFVTRDFGKTWEKIPQTRFPAVLSEQDSDPFSILFVRPHKGWLRTSRGRILWTEDDGMSWNVSAFIEERNPRLLGRDQWVSFPDDRNGLIVVNGQVLMTRDGGASWSPLTPPDERFWSVCCAGNQCLLTSQTRVAEFTLDK